MLSYNRANRAVAILCNHQRAAPKNFSKQMENLQNKVSGLVWWWTICYTQFTTYHWSFFNSNGLTLSQCRINLGRYFRNLYTYMCTFLCSKQFKLCLFIMSLMLTQLVHHWNDWLLTIEFPLLCYYYCKSAIFFKNWKIFLESVKCQIIFVVFSPS